MAGMATETEPGARSGAVTKRGDRAPNSWGLGDGAAIPWEYAPAPESRDVVTIKDRYGLFIGGSEVAASDGQTFATVNPATEEALTQVARGTAGGHGQGGPRRAQRIPEDAGARCRAASGRSTCSGSPRILQERSREFAVLEIDGLRQADQGVARRRRAARGGPLLVLRRLGRQARVRVPGPRREAARRRRPDHPVELPAADARLEDRAGPRRRQHRRPQAGLDDAAQRAALRRRLPPGRPPAGRRQHRPRSRRGRDDARSPTPASTRSRSPARPTSARRSRRASPARTRR